MRIHGIRYAGVCLAALALAALPLAAQEKAKEAPKAKPAAQSKPMAAPAEAPKEKPATIGRVYVTEPKEGMAAQYEAGRKKHMDWHRRQNDASAWLTWEILTGERAGSYVTGTFNHHWKDFDAWAKMEDADNADAAINLDPYTDDSSNSIVSLLPRVSRPVEGATTPAAMSQVIHIHLNPGATDDFMNCIKQFHDAIGKTKWPVNYNWYGVVNGGESPMFILSIPAKDWASMEGPEMPFAAMLEKALGKAAADALRKAYAKTIHCQKSELVRFRPDLSYIPATR